MMSLDKNVMVHWGKARGEVSNMRFTGLACISDGVARGLVKDASRGHLMDNREWLT